MEIIGKIGREAVLRDGLREVTGFEFVLIDCPPSLSLLTVNALNACQFVIIPIQAHPFALDGLGKLMETIALVRRHLNPSLKVLGILITLYDKRTKVSQEMVERLGAMEFEGMNLGDMTFDTVIRMNVRLAEAADAGKPIIFYDPRSRGAEDYRRLAQEFLRRLEEV